MDQGRHPALRKMAAWVLGACLLFLLGDAFIKSEDLVPGARIALVVVASLSAIYWVCSAPPIARRVPSVRFEPRRGGGLLVQVIPPELNEKRKLKKLVSDLARDMRQWRASIPDPSVEAEKDWNAAIRAKNHTTTDEERDAVWEAFHTKRAERDAQAAQAISSNFGGRLQYVLGEFERLGLANSGQVMDIGWHCGSTYWLLDGVSKLEALAMRL